MLGDSAAKASDMSMLTQSPSGLLTLSVEPDSCKDTAPTRLTSLHRPARSRAFGKLGVEYSFKRLQVVFCHFGIKHRVEASYMLASE